MSANASMGGIIAQGSKVEKLQEVQHQGPEWRKQKALNAAEEEKLRQQRQVQKASESDENLSITERERQQNQEPDSEERSKEEKESGHQRDEMPQKSAGSHIIDIVV